MIIICHDSYYRLPGPCILFTIWFGPVGRTIEGSGRGPSVKTETQILSNPFALHRRRFQYTQQISSFFVFGW